MLVKQALAIANALPTANAGINLSTVIMTYGIAFFGTPHSSESYFPLSKALRGMIEAETGSGAKAQGNRERETFEMDRFCDSLQEEFGPLLGWYQWWSFWAEEVRSSNGRRGSSPVC